MSGVSVALRQQYRMPVQLMAFPSAAFYGAKLIARKVAMGILETGDEVIIVFDNLRRLLNSLRKQRILPNLRALDK